ncbi:hypothetical protein D9M71_443320 [compost metagenome]
MDQAVVGQPVASEQLRSAVAGQLETAGADVGHAPLRIVAAAVDHQRQVIEQVAQPRRTDRQGLAALRRYLEVATRAMRPGRQLQARVQVELAQQMADMDLHRTVADAQLAGDQLVAQTLGDQRQRLPLALGQAGQRIELRQVGVVGHTPLPGRTMRVIG